MKEVFTHYAGTFNKKSVQNRAGSSGSKSTNVAVDGMQLSPAAQDTIKRASFRLGEGGVAKSAAAAMARLESAAAGATVAAGGVPAVGGGGSGVAASAGATAGAGAAAAAAATTTEGEAAPALAEEEVPPEATLTPSEAADAALEAALAACAKVERAVQSLARWGLIPTTEAQKIRFAKVKAERDGKLRPGSEVEDAARASFAKHSPPSSASDLSGAAGKVSEAPAEAVEGAAAAAAAEVVVGAAAGAAVGGAAAELAEAVAEAAPGASRGGALPGGWTEHAVDDGSEQVYYHNAATGETAWERPSQSITEGGAVVVPAAAPAAEAVAANDTTGSAVELPPNWTSHVAESGDAAGHTFYSNSVTGEVSWTPPALDGHLPDGYVDDGLQEGWEKVAHDDGGEFSFTVTLYANHAHSLTRSP